MPFFSIIIPTYNRSSLVIGTIKSVLQQSFADHEILVIDDGGTDSTSEMVRETYGSEPRVKVIRQENAERGAARNNGMKHASGDYIMFLDSDDKLRDVCLERYAAFIDKHPGIPFLTGKFIFFQDELEFPSPIASWRQGWYDGSIYLEGQSTGITICIKNNADLLPFEEDRKYATFEDWMFLVQNLLRDKIFVIDEVLLEVNDHPDRSVNADNHIMVSKRKLATDWILNNVKLDKREENILQGRTDYFCAIHSYADSDRTQAMGYIRKAVNKLGWNKKFLILFIKILIGHRLLNPIKKAWLGKR
ncbi:MAG: glycosyltransferase family 2 protein [Bacteroidetes bacterium]|nr:glycosyltransferase family 2 protein [Bacteroidota bacterium]